MSVVFLDCWINVRYKLHCLFCKRVVIMSCRFNMFQTFIKCNFLKRRFLQNTYNVILSIHLIYLSWKICSEIGNQMKLNSFLELFIRNSWHICGLIISRFCQLPGEMLEINCRTFTIFYKIETEKKNKTNVWLVESSRLNFERILPTAQNWLLKFPLAFLLKYS